MNRKRRLVASLAPWAFTALPTLALVAAGWSSAPAQETPRSQTAQVQAAAPAETERLGAVRFSVTPDKPRYISGETVTLTLTATNTGEKPAAVLLPLFDGGIRSAANFTIEDAATGQSVNPNWIDQYAGGIHQRLAQVMVHNTVEARRFRVLKPGESAPIYAATFEAAYLPGNDRPRLKSELPRAARNETPFRAERIAAGTYRVRGMYSWDRAAGFLKTYHFKDLKYKDASAAEHFRTAVTGKAAAQGEFVVIPSGNPAL
jgi:hypothetical protein